MRSDEFEQLYEDHAGSLLAFLIYRTGDRPLAEDLLADTFERVLRSHWRFDRRRASEKTWVYSIALNLLRDHVRRSATEHRAVEALAVGGPEAARDQLEDIEHRELVQRAFSAAGLGPQEREALALRFGADLSMPEVAQVLGEKLPAVEARIYRALKKLKDVVEPL
jgi:RNA polymerase sigma-70 factor (ECF subfamily)